MNSVFLRGGSTTAEQELVLKGIRDTVDDVNNKVKEMQQLL